MWGICSHPVRPNNRPATSSSGPLVSWSLGEPCLDYDHSAATNTIVITKSTLLANYLHPYWAHQSWRCAKKINNNNGGSVLSMSAVRWTPGCAYYLAASAALKPAHTTPPPLQTLWTQYKPRTWASMPGIRKYLINLLGPPTSWSWHWQSLLSWVARMRGPWAPHDASRWLGAEPSLSCYYFFLPFL